MRRRPAAVAVLLGAAVLVLLITSPWSGGGAGPRSAAPASRPQGPLRSGPLRLTAVKSRSSLPAPLSGEAVAARGSRLLISGGLDGAAASTASVLEFDPGAGAVRPAGSLSEPVHDAASATLPAGTLVLGGGSATTLDTVERLRRGGAATVAGRLPQPRSDLSALTVRGSAVVLGGYDGEAPVGSVLRTRDGRSFKTIAQLPVPVRYASVASLGPTVYVLGGELGDGTDSALIQAVDTGSGKATVVGHLPGGLSHASAVTIDGRILLLGGRLDGRTTDQILRFDPARARAQRFGRLPAPTQNAAAGVVADTGYLIGGLDRRGAPLASIVQISLSRPAAPAESG